MARGRTRYSVPRWQRVSSQSRVREPAPPQILEIVHVGTVDPVTQRWKKKEVKRVVRRIQPYHSVGEKGVIIWDKKEVPVYRRYEQLHWTIFLEDVLLSHELQLPPLNIKENSSGTVL